jgi:SAM-dependent MidA family methyltransferase
MQEALYGPQGFYRRPEGPAAHFRTSVHASPLFAGAMYELAQRYGLRTVVDLGAGRGELLKGLSECDPGLRLIGVEVSDRPPGLPDAVEWTDAMPSGLVCLVIANEWLDNIPLDVVTVTDAGLRLVHVDLESGQEVVGPPPDDRDLDWLAGWWPLDAAEVGDRAEVGRTRDDAWAAVLEALAGGTAVAVDYGHVRDDRPAKGTLTGYRGGRQVRPVPDGLCDITAHVAMDSCAAAGAAAGAATTTLTTQRPALHALGVEAERPPLDLARDAPADYVRALSRAGEAAELTDPGGLGGFRWLQQEIR